jgi:hypothetical protein
MNPEPIGPEAPDSGRREALEKLGKLVYTAPVMIAMPLVFRKAAAQEGCPGGEPPPCNPTSEF